MLPYDVDLISITLDYDEIGQPVQVEKKTTIQADTIGVARTEFYQAANAGLKPELVLLVHSFEYSGEKLLEFEGVKYSVLRTYPTERDGLKLTELTCERKIGA